VKDGYVELYDVKPPPPLLVLLGVLHQVACGGDTREIYYGSFSRKT
jgi:hypothetical protein